MGERTHDRRVEKRGFESKKKGRNSKENKRHLTFEMSLLSHLKFMWHTGCIEYHTPDQ